MARCRAWSRTHTRTLKSRIVPHCFIHGGRRGLPHTRQTPIISSAMPRDGSRVSTGAQCPPCIASVLIGQHGTITEDHCPSVDESSGQVSSGEVRAGSAGRPAGRGTPAESATSPHCPASAIVVTPPVLQCRRGRLTVPVPLCRQARVFLPQTRG